MGVLREQAAIEWSWTRLCFGTASVSETVAILGLLSWRAQLPPRVQGVETLQAPLARQTQEERA